jgi:hypothetical protein
MRRLFMLTLIIVLFFWAGSIAFAGNIDPDDSGQQHARTDNLEPTAALVGEACDGTLNGTRWCDQGDGTVKDMTTGLVWLQNSGWGGSKLMIDNATRKVDYFSGVDKLMAGTIGANLSDGSVEGDWRLPTKEELLGLNNGLEAVRAGSMRAFTGVQSGGYWTSNYKIEFPVKIGHNCQDAFKEYGIKPSNAYVWPVRSAD